MARRLSVLLLSAAAVLLLTGCFDDPQIENVVDALEWELQPAELEPEVELRFGRGTLGFVGFLCEISDECDEWEELLEEVDQVHVGVYDVIGSRYVDGLYMTDELRRDLLYDDWKLVVSARDEWESHFVLTSADEEGIHEILVISYDGDQAVVVRLEGDLAAALHHLVHDRDSEFNIAHSGHWEHDF